MNFCTAAEAAVFASADIQVKGTAVQYPAGGLRYCSWSAAQCSPAGWSYGEAHADRIDIEQDVVGFLHNIELNIIGFGEIPELPYAGSGTVRVPE